MIACRPDLRLCAEISCLVKCHQMRYVVLGEMPSDAVRHQGSCNILSKMGELIFDALYAVAGGALQRLSDL